MNIYVVVEGEIGEKLVYGCWIPFVNPALSVTPTIDQVSNNSVHIIGGGGFPNYFEVIADAMEDMKADVRFDRLVVAIDSEEASFTEKYTEVEEFITQTGFSRDYRIVVQHFCLETWALGNRKIMSRQVKNPRLKRYKQMHDVSKDDPELLPGLPEDELNRAGFAGRYLRLLLNEKYRNLSYTKSNPKQLMHAKYFEEVKRRHSDTTHIGSFRHFLDAFV